MRSARVDSRVMRTIFGLVAACAEIVDNAMRATRSAADVVRNMETSLPQRSRKWTHTGESRAATQSFDISIIMGARITAYLALYINPEPCPLSAGLCCRCA